MPWTFGGLANGDHRNLDMNNLFPIYQKNLYYYSLFTYGYHAGDFIQHTFFDERLNDFEEMLLHHIAAVCLYFAYIFSNFLIFGSMVAYLHDLADIFGKITKGLNATIYQTESGYAFFGVYFVWLYTRIWLLPQIIYFLFFDEKTKFAPAQAQFQPFIFLNAVFLSVMCILHYFWFGLFNKMLYVFIVYGKADDAQNKV